MRMRKSMNQKVCAMLCILTMVFCSTAIAFADDNSVTAYMTVPAAAIDVTISESIQMTGTANAVDLTVDKLTVTNNSSAGVVNIDSISATAASGWQLVEQNTDFKSLSANAKKLSLIPTLGSSTWDITKACPSFATVDSNVPAGTSKDVTFSGKTGIVTVAIDKVQVVNIIVTLSLT